MIYIIYAYVKVVAARAARVAGVALMLLGAAVIAWPELLAAISLINPFAILAVA